METSGELRDDSGAYLGPQKPPNYELIEHRINETAESVKDIRRETQAIKESVIRIETRLENMASSKELADVKTGIERVKVWVLTGALAGIGTGDRSRNRSDLFDCQTIGRVWAVIPVDPLLAISVPKIGAKPLHFKLRHYPPSHGKMTVPLIRPLARPLARRCRLPSFRQPLLIV